MLQMMNKLQRLKRAQPNILMRYACLSKLLPAGVFRLADIRLQILQYGNGRVKLYEAAPIVQAGTNGVPVIKYATDNVFKIIQGTNSGILIQGLPKEQEEGSVYVPAPHTGQYDVLSQSSRNHIELAAQLAHTPYIPVCDILEPTYIRLARTKSSLRPRIDTQMLQLIGRQPDKILDSICTDMPCGSVAAPFQSIYSGGMCAAHAAMVDRKAVHNLFGMSKQVFMLRLAAKNWDLPMEE